MNRLASESSPYLRQHANNPVHWYPWSDEAFAQAKADDKPVLLSIGYSSCHWCHVMAHESFEDQSVAELMNEYFVNIKVDREERPDIDAIYMEATQAMTGSGGWPMTVFLAPDGKPFFAGTYFGKQSMPGHPSFVELINAVHIAWKDQREEVTRQADNLTEAIKARTHASAEATNAPPARELTALAAQAIAESHDEQWGGFSPAPKFPPSALLDLLMRTRDDSYLPAVQNTLDAMASGGIYDHVGGGFHRYSVDAFWMVPHFEKMLYDQALLARTYIDAFLITGYERYRQVATETIEYVIRDLGATSGGWYSSEDADSEGEEGVFYIWRPEAIDAAIDDEPAAAAFREWYGVTASGNFEGANILHRPQRGDLLRSDAVEAGRQRLFAARQQRVRPGLDDKVITEWNAMFVATLAYAAGALDRPDWRAAAVNAAEFLLKNLRTDDGRWLRVWHQDGGAKQLAFANDYAWLVEAFYELSEATGKSQWRSLAVETASQMLELFGDSEQGGLFTTGQDAEALIVRPKELFDGAIPSSNSTAALALARIWQLTGREDMAKHSEALVNLVADALVGHPAAFPRLLAAAELLEGRGTQLVIAGDRPDLVDAARSAFRPRTVLLWGERDDSALWNDRIEGAYLCHDFTCELPTQIRSDLVTSLART